MEQSNKKSFTQILKQSFTKDKLAVTTRRILNSALPVILAFVIGGVIIALLNENPFTTYGLMIEKSLFSVRGLGNTFHYAAPLILAALAIAITFKANIFNMGVEGQLIFGGFVAGLAGAYFQGMTPVVHKIVCFFIGGFAGMLFALLPALLKAYYRVDELVVTLTLNYAMAKVLEYLASGPFREQGSGYVSSPIVQQEAMFTRLGTSRMTMFVFVALFIFLIMVFVMKKTTLGYSIEAIGKNPVFAEAIGLRTRRKIIILMIISGVLAGFAGTGHMLSERFKYTLDFSASPGIGWDGMLIALLGRHSPVGIFIACVFYSALKTGADNINMYTTVPREIVSVIQSLIILFLSFQFLDERFGIFSQIKKYMSKGEAQEEDQL